MSKLPWPRRSRPSVSWDGNLDGLLDGEAAPVEAMESTHLVAGLVAALVAPPAPDELTGQAGALTAFRAAAGRSVRPTRSRRWRPPVLTSLLSAKLAAALAVGAVSAGGVAVAAYSGALPVPAQNFAHHAIGAPAAHKHEKKDKPAKPSASATADPSATPTHGVGPDATGPAAFGLCQAFNKERTHGKVEERSVAFRNLATAAGGADKIAAYCATIPHPSADPSERPDENASEHPSESSEHPTGKPTELPNPHSSGHAKGKPSAGSDEGNQD